MSGNWLKKFNQLADTVALWSKDKHSQVGCVIVDSNNRVLSLGYNGLPQGANDEIEDRFERPTKYYYMEHAERNAIYTAARNGVVLDGSSIIINKFPCVDCARAIIQSGIKTVHCPSPDYLNHQWGISSQHAMILMLECGLKVITNDKEKSK